MEVKGFEQFSLKGVEDFVFGGGAGWQRGGQFLKGS